MRILVYETCQHEAGFYAISKALKEKGHDIDTFDPTNIFKFKFNLLNRIINKFFIYVLIIGINKSFKNKFSKKIYDIIIIMRGEHLMPETLKYIKSFDTKLVNWSSDDFFNATTTLKVLDRSNVVKVLKSYDCIFTPRMHLATEYLKLGAKRVELLNWYHRPGLKFASEKVPAQNYLYEISFIGAWSPRREQILSALPQKLHIWGWGWGKHASKNFIKKNICHGQIGMTKMMSIFNQSKININILTVENRDTTNFRNYEIPASGGFQLAEWSHDISELFIPNNEIVLFKNENELVQKTEEYLRGEKKREEIARNGYRRVDCYDCSIDSRVSNILSKI